jgi:hypothetical protein
VTDPIFVTEGTVTRVELVARLGRTISGRVVDSLHAPVPKPEICFELPGCGMCNEGEEDGRFELGGLPPDTFELEVSNESSTGDHEHPIRTKITVPAGASDRGEIVLPAR